MPVMPALWVWEQENQKFKVIFDYVASFRPVWAIDPVSKTIKVK